MNETSLKIKAIIVSAGDGIRVGGTIPKQYQKIGGIHFGANYKTVCRIKHYR